MASVAAGRFEGAACGLLVAAIAAGWSVLTRLAVTTGLDAWDIALLRFGVGGLLLAPIALLRGFAWDRLGWRRFCALVVCGGVPYVLLAAEGLQFAPASDQGALNPGSTPLFVGLLAPRLLCERPSAGQRAGLGLILLGCLGLVAAHASGWSGTRSLGDGLFLAAGLCWAIFTVAMRRVRLDPLHAAALVAATSLVLYLPPYIALRGLRVVLSPHGPLLWQAGYQGVLVTILLLVLYARAVAIFAPAGGAAFLALVPGLSALFATVLLGERPAAADWAAIGLISAGVLLTSGAVARYYPDGSLSA